MVCSSPSLRFISPSFCWANSTSFWRNFRHAGQSFKRDKDDKCVIAETQGILVPHGKKGLSVADLDAKNLLKLLDVRKQLDCLGVRLAAQRVTDGSMIDEDHETIEAINRLISDSHLLIVNGEHLKLVRSDISFHKLLRALSGNEFIQSVLEPHLLHHNRLVSAMSINRHTKIWHQHQEILGAILQGNGKLAEQTMMEHINSAAAAIDWKRDTNG
jgi:DNA-binding GntR family transcriptional regulator